MSHHTHHRLAAWILLLVALSGPRLVQAGLEELIVAAKPGVVAVGTFNPTDSPVFDVASGQVVAVINMVLVRGSKESALTHPS